MADDDTETKRKYIGDGVYATFDGYQMWLTTERYGQDHSVAIEPEVWESLKSYANWVWGERA